MTALYHFCITLLNKMLDYQYQLLHLDWLTLRGAGSRSEPN